MLSRFLRWSLYTNKALAALACIVLVAMALSTIIDVLGRFFFNHPLAGSVEMGTEMVVAVVFLSIAYIQLQRRNINIDIVSSRLPKRIKTWVDIIGEIIMFVVSAFLTWRCVLKAVESLQSGEVSYGLVAIPYAPARIIVAVGLALLSLVLLLQICGRIWGER